MHPGGGRGSGDTGLAGARTPRLTVTPFHDDVTHGIFVTRLDRLAEARSDDRFR
jgi:hypothetical protein